MRITIRLQSATASVCQYWLLSGQTLSVGRTRAADWTVGDDPLMSSVHFKLECDAEECRLVDLGSTNGTFVNEERVQETSLKEGDVIRAGKSQFKVLQCTAPPKRKSRPRLHDATAFPGENRQADRRATRHSTAQPRRSFTTKESQADKPRDPNAPCRHPLADACPKSPTDIASTLASMTFVACPSTARCWAAARDAFPETLHDALATQFHMYLIVAPRHAHMLHDAITTSSEFLFDWIPGSLASRLSPRLLEGTTWAEHRALLGDLWASSAFFCCYSNQPRPTVLRRLRLAARGCIDEQQVSDPQLLFGASDPADLSRLLCNAPPWYTTAFFQDIAAVLCSSADQRIVLTAKAQSECDTFAT